MSSGNSSSISRTDFYVESDPGISIYVREIRDRSTNVDNDPILLVARSPCARGRFLDLQVPGGSLAEDLAKAGFTAFIMDIRGYGRSTRPKEMSDPPNNIRLWYAQTTLSAISTQRLTRSESGPAGSESRSLVGRPVDNGAAITRRCTPTN